MNKGPLWLWVRTGLLLALVDGLWAVVLSVGFYGSTFARLWQGVAAVPLGPGAMDGGTRTTLVGLLLHVAVAFTWSGVFVLLARQLPALRSAIGTVGGALVVAAVYGPFIWAVMSLVVIPTLTQRAPTITIRWWIQLLGHIAFVGTPIVLSVRAGLHRLASGAARAFA